MYKETIFFSHATADKDVIKPIKDRLQAITSGTVKIFMSSDGSSIPFGKNWISEIEDALKLCKIMFVWITPNSVERKWIYFEAGYAYARGIEVIPIGMNGIDLGKLSPPISLLQGFNVTSHASLNNIVTIINDKMSTTFAGGFTEDFYNENVAVSNSGESTEYLNLCSGVVVSMETFSVNGVTAETLDDSIDRFELYLKNNSIKYHRIKNIIHMRGWRASRQRIERAGSAAIGNQCFIDPIALDYCWKDLAQLNRLSYATDSGVDRLFLDVSMEEDVEYLCDTALISSRLLNLEEFTTDDIPFQVYKFKNIRFRFNFRYNHESNISELTLRVIAENDSQRIPLNDLIHLLIKAKVFTVR